MIRIYYFSGSGHSKAVADYMANRLETEATELTAYAGEFVSVAVVIFPVYCQNLPPMVGAFLKSLQADHAALIATYGGFSPGNVLQEGAKLTSATVIAGACIPTGHSFLREEAVFDAEALEPLAARIHAPKEVGLPRLAKNPFSDLFPAWRSRIGLKLSKNQSCTACGACTKLCPMSAMENGKANRKCIRCLRCVSLCPQKALTFHPRLPLARYLKGNRHPRLHLYL